ncbi:XrtA-associated ATPase [Alteriqipengyuania flavescens]|uniref:XrtA/PEP-CTERM system-associated ATPase n=1 Tax=Alteriqipengyuania flavescens TaxID=3053610 RepID=UPI0025B5E51A|nr:XrtA/PEP-CTERM system-associated ATPase [Alteriqipengyuania flavescens]WJY18465.1 XrtA-associated ATPase [Alteriqipengyuania flavescens]WJY24406.1 XrtA-associated ATPase [Alteriqipengyuania flavescens]
MFDEFYGLTGRPFQLTPDAAFYFQSGTHRKALSYLGYGLAQGEGFIVITGAIGSGKSTLVAHLTSTIDPSQLTIAQIVTSKLDEEEVVHVVAQAFGIEVEGHDKATALGMIESLLHEEARAGRRCLLIIDESQNLSIEALEELRMFSNFQLGNHPLLQTLLLGQPEFRHTLQQHPALEQLRQRVIATHHLEAMEPSEVKPYIEHRLKCVGWDGEWPRFDEAVFAKLYEATDGVPRKINQVATRLLLLGAVEQKTYLDTDMLQDVLDEIAADNGVAPAPRPVAQPIAAEPPSADDFAEEPEETADFSAPEPEAAEIAEPEPVPTVDLEAVHALLAERDAQIAELQQAIVELSEARDTEGNDDTDFAERLSRIEDQLSDQERIIRHTLTMLIDWIENDRSIAA